MRSTCKAVLCRFSCSPSTDLIRRPFRSFTSCSLMWSCSSPEPGTNYGMHPHDHAALNGTARGYAIVSRTREATACRNHPAIVPGEPANWRPGSDEHPKCPFSPGRQFARCQCRSVSAGKVVDPRQVFGAEPLGRQILNPSQGGYLRVRANGHMATE